MGLQLDNPIIVGSSGLTETVEGIRRCADAGAGAVVMKSLFDPHAEPEYMRILNGAKRAVSIPVIASLACDSISTWRHCSRAAWNAGADALELNISVAPRLTIGFSKAIEDLYITVLEEIKRTVTIPVSVKVHPYITSMMRLAYVLAGSGASAMVLFNRFRRIDIDIDALRLVAGPSLSAPEEMYHGLHWITLLFGKVPVDLVGATGIYNGDDVIKQLLAGVQVVQLCSALHKGGPGTIRSVLKRTAGWMRDHAYSRIDDFRGLLSQHRSEQPDVHERLQYAADSPGGG